MKNVSEKYINENAKKCNPYVCKGNMKFIL